MPLASKAVGALCHQMRNFSLEENETTYADDVAKTKIVKDPDEKIENKD